MAKKLCYRKEKDGKYWLDIDGSKRYGLAFSSIKTMRKAVKRKYKLKKCGK